MTHAIVLVIALMHIIQGALGFFGQIGPIASLGLLEGGLGPNTVDAILITAGLAALAALRQRGRAYVLWLAPQQVLLFAAFVGALSAIIAGHYAAWVAVSAVLLWLLL